jgi:hypothetical protein
VKVRIRMYRLGLGDCFLLTFAPDGKAVHVLIDCGVLLGTKNAEKIVKESVEDILKTTGGRLDVIVATHEHWDHVSGFAQAKSLFDDSKQLEKLDQIWFAWTESPDDKLAKQLRDERAKRKKNLGTALGLWKAKVGEGKPDGDPSLASTRLALTESVLGFSAPELLGAKTTTADALGYLKQRDERKEYLEPGTSRRLPRLDDVRVFVLGPPRDEQLLKKGRPSTKAPETYSEDENALTMADSFFAAVETAAAKDDAKIDTNDHPFDDFYRVEARTQRDVDFLRQDPRSFYNEHYFAKDEWRRIDADWLGTTGELALALDNDTNNTSLVLAFELGENGDVLLFPADAQVGNWLSWKAMKFDVRRADGTRRTVTTEQLLARTVFYKVGHHASHNATLREHGLEKMTHDELVAMIPIERKTAKRLGWDMPFPPLLDRLTEKCHGRVLLLDEAKGNKQLARRLSKLDAAEQQQFDKRFVTTDLYVELTIDR